jgi:nucleotidyltransferase/DNA polymerase involved in DNA repair
VSILSLGISPRSIAQGAPEARTDIPVTGPPRRTKLNWRGRGSGNFRYYWISRGVDNREVRADRIRKSIGAENTFSSDLIDFEAMPSKLQPLIDKVWRQCEDKGTRGRTATLKVKFADFELVTRSRTIPKPINNGGDREESCFPP